jgi:Cu(I)/Ag(I) efflux system membrane fusion protein
VIPKTAVLWTGKRSIVYVKNQKAKSAEFELREVTLGADFGTQYEVISGLENGEEIAVNGAFTIDAAAQLEGKPSMLDR